MYSRDHTRWDKPAKNLRYKCDKKDFHRKRWEDLSIKERDYWRGRVQQWDQDKRYAEQLRHSSSSS
jgi:hypothetical protein